MRFTDSRKKNNSLIEKDNDEAPFMEVVRARHPVIIFKNRSFIHSIKFVIKVLETLMTADAAFVPNDIALGDFDDSSIDATGQHSFRYSTIFLLPTIKSL